MCSPVGWLFKFIVVWWSRLEVVVSAVDQQAAATPEDVDMFLGAVSGGDLEKIKHYINLGIVNSASASGETPLHVSAISGNTEVRDLYCM